MSPQRVQAVLRRIDPDVVVARSARTDKWVVQKWVEETVYQHPNPCLIPSSGVHVTCERRRILRTQFALPFGLTERSVEHAKRAMFWKRGVSSNEVAAAMDRDDALLRQSKANDRHNFNESFRTDYGKQFEKKIKGEPTIQAGVTLKS